MQSTLACRTCDYVMSADELEKGMELNSGVGVLGKLSSHRKSTQHMAAVNKANEPQKKGPLDNIFSTQPQQQQQQQQQQQ
jgi:hypothetical protein|eukprot:evm.model.NODE_7323_length_3729_cov_50.724323.2